MRVIGAKAERLWARFARLRCRDERGSTLVEAAIILPVVILLTFGAIDFGIGFNSKAGLDNAGRSGVRVGATKAAENNPLPVSGIPANTIIGWYAGSAVNSSLSQIEELPELQDLYVFRSTASSPTGPATWSPSSVSSAAACTNDCIHYKPTADGKQFDLLSPVGGTWPAGTNFSERLACQFNADRIGITIVAKYHFLTGLIGTTVPLTSTNVAQLEPTTNC